ncbi:hypothetical protein Hdeb2414_s0018g00536471 [Helianthus debilis subsp. tardiflorus]
MEIDFPSEVGPTKETVDALMEYLVGPLLPLKHTDFAKETPSESKQKSVAKQVHAAVVLYNYYHLNHHREIQFLKFEKAIMDACTISETLLNASANISNVINEWQVTKVAVLLIDSKKENCFLQFNNGVWSVIEKDVYPESKKRKKVMIEYDNDGLQKLAFLAVKEVAGIVYHELKVLESHVVYSLSQAKTATRFYIVQSTQEISEDNLVPIQDVLSSLQGPVVKECLGSWGITPVVEYYYLLPYAEIISKLFSRESNSLPNEVKDESSDVSIGQRSQKSCEKESGESKKVSGNVQKKSKLDSEVVHNSKKESGQSKEVSNNLQKKSNMESKNVHVGNSIKEESRDSKDSKSAYKSNECSEKESGQSKEVSDNLQKKSKLDSETERVSSSVKEESHDSKVSKNGCESNQFSYTSESVSKVADDAITSQFTATHVDQKVKDSENSVGNSITVSNGDGVKQEDMNGSSGADNKLDVDKILVCFQKESQNSKVHAPLKVYRHVKRSTPTKSTNSKAANTEDLKKMSTVSQSKDERVNGDKGSCMVPPNEDRSLTVNYILDDFHSIVDAKRSELSDAALRALLHKRQKLYDQQRVIEGELTLCDKKIQAIMHGGIGDCLGLKLDVVIDCCNEICNQDDMQTQQRTKLLVSRSVPLLSGKSLSEAQLTLRKACQELDDICLSNDWMLPTYSTSRSDGGFVANVTVKGANFECSGVSGNLPSIHEARNSAATHMIMRLQQMANETKTASLA